MRRFILHSSDNPERRYECVLWSNGCVTINIAPESYRTRFHSLEAFQSTFGDDTIEWVDAEEKERMVPDLLILKTDKRRIVLSSAFIEYHLIGAEHTHSRQYRLPNGDVPGAVAICDLSEDELIQSIITHYPNGLLCAYQKMLEDEIEELKDRLICTRTKLLATKK